MPWENPEVPTKYLDQSRQASFRRRSFLVLAGALSSWAAADELVESKELDAKPQNARYSYGHLRFRCDSNGTPLLTYLDVCLIIEV